MQRVSRNIETGEVNISFFDLHVALCEFLVVAFTLLQPSDDQFVSDFERTDAGLRLSAKLFPVFGHCAGGLLAIECRWKLSAQLHIFGQELLGKSGTALQTGQHRVAVPTAPLLFPLFVPAHPDLFPVSGNAASKDTRA
jgi:hypothetical protein